MKKLVISIFLAFMMLTSLVPATYAANISKNSNRTYFTQGSYSSGKKDVFDKDEQTALIIVAVVVAIVIVPIAIGSYVYSSFALMKIANKLNAEHTWFAWVPVLNAILLFKLGDQNPFFLFFVLLPIAGPVIVFVLSVIAYMNLCEKFGRDRLLGLLKISGLGELILLGILTWHKDSVVAKKK